MSLRQTISLMLEEASKTKLVADMRAAGEKGVAALRQEFQRKMGDLRADFSQGLIDERSFRDQARRVADAFNQEIIKRMDALKAAGRDTSKEYAELGRQIKVASDTGIRSGGLLTSAWGKVKTFATGVGAAIAAAFTVRAVVDFAKESIAAAVTVGRSWNEIGNAVKAVGGNFVALRPQIEDTVERIASSLAFDDEEIRDGLTRFIRATGSVDKGLRGIEVAAKLARAGNISVQQATDILTRSLETGNVRALTPFVGNLKGTKDVLGDVDRALGDVASTVSPFEKGTRLLSESWEDLRVAFGNALIAGAEGASVFDVLTNAVKGMAEWVNRNKTTIAAWAKFVINEFVILGRGISNTFNGIVAFFDPGSNFWRSIRISFLEFGEVILGEILRLQQGMLSLSESLPGDPFAEQIRRAMDKTSGYIKGLGVEISAQAAGMRNSLGSDDPDANRTSSIGGGFAANIGAGAGKATEALDEAGKEAKRIADEMAEAHRRANAQNLAVTTDTQKAIQDAYIETGDAAKRGGIMSQEATRATAAESEAYANTLRNHAEEYWKRDVPLFLQGQKAQQAELKKTGETGTKAAEDTKGSWLDALGVMNSAFQNLGSVVGGVVGRIVDGFGGIVNAASAIASGIAGISTKVGGLTGLLTKLAGGASLIGGIITAAGVAIDIIGGLGEVLGIKRSKDEGRFGTNRKAREFGAQNPTGIFQNGLTAIEFLIKMAQEWGSPVAQEDAKRTLVALVADLAKVGRLPKEYQYLVGRTTENVIGGGAITPRAPRAPAGPAPFSPFTPGSFQHGGWIPETGYHRLHAGELVLNAAQQMQLAGMLGVAGQPSRQSISNDNSSRSLNVNVYLTGVADRDVPQRVIDAIKVELGQEFQRRAMLQGNARME